MQHECLTIQLSVRRLVEFVLRCGSIDSRFAGFNRAAEGSRIHRKLQKAAGSSYQSEVSFTAERQIDDIHYVLDGRADGIIQDETGAYTVDEIKTTAAPAELLTADFNPLHWAQAKCYAAFLCEQKGLDAVQVQLTYYQIDTNEIIRHRRRFTAAELEAFLESTLRLYNPWAKRSFEWAETRSHSLKALTFPFSAYRPGQYEMAGAVYRTICAGGRLFCCAPTGIGKTISTLFPSLKALGEQRGERIFYLTAKNTTCQAAEDALSRLAAHSSKSKAPMRLKTITLSAKDKICPMEERLCTPQTCPRANGYFDRINDALFEFLSQHDRFTRSDIEHFAQQKCLCPFELSLDLTNWCDCIICDYNYLFDPVVNLKRFFADGGDFIFLVDEAHNLVDRARNMYSASIQKSSVYHLIKSLGNRHRKLTGALKKVNAALIELRKHAQAEKTQQLVIPEGLADLTKTLMRLSAACEDWLEDHREDILRDEVLSFYFELHFFLLIAEFYDTHYTTLVSVSRSEVTVQLICLDASSFLDHSMALGRASILFSATLSPADYFIKTLGGGQNARFLSLCSPFAPEQLCIAVADRVSTKYNDRDTSREEVCRLIAAAVTAKPGNYIVFLPSYKYMQDIYDTFCDLFPDIAVAIQESSMTQAQREDFLMLFSAQSKRTFVGFCVLGGVFSEGVDLAGERLIGTIIVGVGLPQIGTEQNMLREYYESETGMGFEYAYQYPGMNKVLQAAGRVIRTEQDRGIILLIDTRYAYSSYRNLLPPYWSHMQRVRSETELTNLLAQFWNNEAK